MDPLLGGGAVALALFPWIARATGGSYVLSTAFVSFVLAAVQPAWHTDYDAAIRAAEQHKKDLVVYFHDESTASFDGVLKHSDVQKELNRFVCLKIPASYQYKGERLLDHAALREMTGKPGLAVVCYSDKSLASYREVISVHPFVGSHYGCGCRANGRSK